MVIPIGHAKIRIFTLLKRSVMDYNRICLIIVIPKP